MASPCDRMQLQQQGIGQLMEQLVFADVTGDSSGDSEFDGNDREVVVDKEQHLYDKCVAAPLYEVACRVLTNCGSVVRAAKLLTKLGC